MSATDYEEVRAGINRIEAENAALRVENERLKQERDSWRNKYLAMDGRLAICVEQRNEARRLLAEAERLVLRAVADEDGLDGAVASQFLTDTRDFLKKLEGK